VYGRKNGIGGDFRFCEKMGDFWEFSQTREFFAPTAIVKGARFVLDFFGKNAIISADVGKISRIGV